MAMLAAGGYGSRPGLSGLAEFPPSPLLYRHAPAPFPGATPAGSLPGVRDLEIKSEPLLNPSAGPIFNGNTDPAGSTF